jgi:hypothetical protein
MSDIACRPENIEARPRRRRTPIRPPSEYDADFDLAKTTTNDIQSTQMNHVTGENGGRVASYYMSDVACHPQHDVDPPKTNMTTSTQEYDDNVVKKTHANRNL